MTTLNTPIQLQFRVIPRLSVRSAQGEDRNYRAFCWLMPRKPARLRADGVWQNTVTTRHWHGGPYNIGWTDSDKVNTALLEFLVSTDSLKGGRQ